MKSSFITIPSWLRTEYNLCGNELLIASIILGFSQDGQGCFTGSRQYLADWCGASIPTVARALTELTQRGIVLKSVITMPDGQQHPTYRFANVTRETKHEEHETKQDNTDTDTINEIISSWNDFAQIHGLQKITSISEHRKNAVKRILKKYTIEELKQGFDLISKSDFLLGKKTTWKATFDFVFNVTNFAKILDGNYNNTKNINNKTSSTNEMLKNLFTA